MSRGYEMVCPFWIDTDAYSDRDRQMFTAGFEFAGILAHLEHNPGPLNKPIHRENESRVRMACGRFSRTCEIKAAKRKHDPQGTWSHLIVHAKT